MVILGADLTWETRAREPSEGVREGKATVRFTVGLKFCGITLEGRREAVWREETRESAMIVVVAAVGGGLGNLFGVARFDFRDVGASDSALLTVAFHFERTREYLYRHVVLHGRRLGVVV